MTARNRWLAIAAVAGLVAVLATAVWLPRGGAVRRDFLARKAAVGVVAASARGDVTELGSRFGRAIGPAEAALLGEAVPDRLGNDPIMYEAVFLNPVRPDAVEVEVQSQSDSEFAALVSMTWDERRGELRVTALERVAPK